MKQEHFIEKEPVLTIDAIKTSALLSQLCYFKWSLILKNPALLPPSKDWEPLESLSYKKNESNGSSASKGGVVGSVNDSCNAIRDFLFSEYLHAYAFKNHDQNEVIIAFKGIDALDLKTLEMVKKIMQGQFVVLSDKLISFVKSIILENKGASIKLVGHSLGGYIAKKVLLHFSLDSKLGKHIKAVYTFDAPGVESNYCSHVDNKKINEKLFNFINSPNFVNCSGIHLGKLYYLPIDNSMNYNQPIMEIRKIIKTAFDETQIGTTLRKMATDCFIKPFACAAITKMHLVDSDTAIKIVNACETSGSQFCREVEEQIAQYRLFEKFNHTLDTHRMEYFVCGIYGHKDRLPLIEITKKWVSARSFFEDDLKSTVAWKDNILRDSGFQQQSLEKNGDTFDELEEKEEKEREEERTSSTTGVMSWIWTWGKSRNMSEQKSEESESKNGFNC